jgi:hypothetical protein
MGNPTLIAKNLCHCNAQRYNFYVTLHIKLYESEGLDFSCDFATCETTAKTWFGIPAYAHLSYWQFPRLSLYTKKQHCKGEIALDYRDHKIVIKNKNILEFIRRLAAGEFLIPTFQRLFVWNPDDIVCLWDSLFHGYPIGSILCWDTEIRLHVHRKLGGFFIPENGGLASSMQTYILDGQQRATALLASFYGGAGKIKEHNAFDYTLYFNLAKAIFFFEKDYYRHRWEADSSLLIRVKEAPDLPAGYEQKLIGKLGYAASVEKNIEQIKYLFSDYSVPLIHLKGFDLEGVCSIYERMNQTGMRLQHMDILIARGFKNYATVVEEDFPVV